MSTKNTLFYRGNTSISVDFSSEEISSDGSIVLLDQLERSNKIIDYFSNLIPDKRHPLLIPHTINKLLKQRVLSIVAIPHIKLKFHIL